LHPVQSLSELHAQVRQKFQIADDVALEWHTHDGALIDAHAPLATQLRDADWTRQGGCELVLGIAGQSVSADAAKRRSTTIAHGTVQPAASTSASTLAANERNSIGGGLSVDKKRSLRKPAKSTDQVARPGFLRDITKLGKLRDRQLAPSRVSSDLAELEDDVVDDDKGPVLCHITSPLSTGGGTSMRLPRHSPISDLLPDVCAKLKIENAAERCVWVGGVMLFDSETLAEHSKNQQGTLQIEVRTRFHSPHAHADVTTAHDEHEPATNSNNNNSNNNTSDDDQPLPPPSAPAPPGPEDSPKRRKSHDGRRKTTQKREDSSSALRESVDESNSSTATPSPAATATTPVSVTASGRIETVAVLQLIEGADGDAAVPEPTAVELRRSLTMSSGDGPEDPALALRAVAMCGIKLNADDKLRRLGRCRVKRKATFKSNWQPRVLVVTSSQVVVMAPKEKAKHHVQLDLATVSVTKKDDNQLEVTPTDDEKNSIVLQFDSTAERDTWNVEVLEAIAELKK
jgi:hypothetical protein